MKIKCFKSSQACLLKLDAISKLQQDFNALKYRQACLLKLDADDGLSQHTHLLQLFVFTHKEITNV